MAILFSFFGFAEDLGAEDVDLSVFRLPGVGR